MNTDKCFGMAKAIQESIDITFGTNAIETQLETDRSAYELSGAALHAPEREYDSRKQEQHIA